MNIQQANLLLEKINGLHKSISLDEGEVSSIERDLMMSYIRQFYEAYMDAEATAVAMPVKKTVPRPKPVPAPKPIPKPAPVVVEKAPPPPSVVVQSEPAPPLPPKPAVKVAPPPAPSVSKASPAIEALFSHRAATELSEKLSQQNISDLTKALSINDKLLYSNELFGRDMSGMNTVLGQLNKLPSMDEAKALLVSIAEKNDWANGERLEVAESFIKLIRRRY